MTCLLYLKFNKLNKYNKMKDMLVVAKLNEGKFETFMKFMQSDEGIAERKKVADLSKTLGTVSPAVDFVLPSL